MKLRMFGLGLLLAGACATDVVERSDGVVVRLATEPAIGEPCDHEHDHACAIGLTCMTYYGVGGPSGPEFETCEIPCGAKPECPDGLTCGLFTEGPGSVCR